jgi:hypothetical protein
MDDIKIGESFSTEYVDNTIEFNKNYKYKVRAVDESGFFSDFSSSINAAVTDNEAPSKPSNLKLVSKTFTSIKFIWSHQPTMWERFAMRFTVTVP